jgi:hypothetical protein
MLQIFFARGPPHLPYTTRWLNIHMSRDFIPVLNLMLFLLIMLWMIMTCVGCSMSRFPAKQTTKTTSSQMQIISSVPTSTIDADGDGTITAQESNKLMLQHQGVLPTFISIVAAVVVVCIMSSWISNRSKHPPSGTS